MGEMSSMIGGIMKGTQGPADPGVQQTAKPEIGPYAPTALESTASKMPDFTEPAKPASLPGGTGMLRDPSQFTGNPNAPLPDTGGGGYNLQGMLSVANGTANLARGLMSDFSRGPGGSPLAPRSVGGGMPYQPTAKNRPMTLQDLLARR